MSAIYGQRTWLRITRIGREIGFSKERRGQTDLKYSRATCCYYPLTRPDEQALSCSACFMPPWLFLVNLPHQKSGSLTLGWAVSNPELA
jgi:hypothetical protein